MNHYEILGVSKTASQDEIKKAYKDLVKKYHPDIYKGDKTFAEKKTAQINVAYEVLSNPETKKEYDEETFPKVEYSYTPPQASQSYDDYKNKYSSYKQNYTRDGSEHDYSTYANYNKYYTDYHRSKTPNSNYTYYEEQFSDKIFHKVDKMSNLNQKRMIVISIIIYIILLLSCIIQLKNFIISSSSKNESINSNTENIVEEDYEKDYNPYQNFINKDSETNSNTSNTTLVPNNITNSTSTNNINLYDYFTEEELQSLYSELISTGVYNITYEEFEQILCDYIQAIHSSH